MLVLFTKEPIKWSFNNNLFKELELEELEIEMKLEFPLLEFQNSGILLNILPTIVEH